MKLTEDIILRAVDDVVAICAEHEGASLEEKLMVFGVDVEMLGDVIMDRWADHAPEFGDAEPSMAFIAGATEFFLAGMKAQRERTRV